MPIYNNIGINEKHHLKIPSHNSAVWQLIALFGKSTQYIHYISAFNAIDLPCTVVMDIPRQFISAKSVSKYRMLGYMKIYFLMF